MFLEQEQLLNRLITSLRCADVLRYNACGLTSHIACSTYLIL